MAEAHKIKGALEAPDTEAEALAKKLPPGYYLYRGVLHGCYALTDGNGRAVMSGAGLNDIENWIETKKTLKAG